MNLKDLKVIITGGAQGMGAYFAKQLQAAGAQVACGDVNEAGLAELPKGIHRRKLDVASDDDINSFVTWAAEQMGGLNGLINNAGILRDGLLVKKDRTTGQITKLSRAEWDKVIAVNLTGATMMVQAVVSKMAETGQKPGVIVNVASVVAHYGNFGQANYVASKAAIIGLTKTLARELGRAGIRVNAVA
ncbi:MAG: SDR family NAD(P)-dependent oxidoreductase, partial [Myxococcaceae bacterium]